MSQSTDLTISNQLMPNARAEINSIFGAIGSNHKGGSRPSYVLTGMTWIDDTSTPWAYNLYDGAGDITFMEFNPAGDTVNLVSVVDVEAGGSAGVVIKNSGGTTVATLGSGNTTNVTFAGTVNIDEIGTLTTQLSVTNGGTGLDALGTAGQMLKVNAGGTALEYGLVGADNIDIESAGAGTIAADDEILFADVNDGDAVKKTTAQAIAALAGGGWVPLQTQTVSSAVASVDFTSGIDGTYKAYAIVFQCSPANDAVNMSVRLGNGGTFDSGASDYDYRSNGTGVTNVAQIVISGNDIGNDAGEGIGGHLIILDPSNASQFTRFNGLFTYTSNSAGIEQFTIGAQRAEAAAHDRIQFYFSSGNIASGTFTLYGLAGA